MAMECKEHIGSKSAKLTLVVVTVGTVRSQLDLADIIMSVSYIQQNPLVFLSLPLTTYRIS